MPDQVEQHPPDPRIATAWHGFREMSPSNYFATVQALGIEFVEVPLYDYKLSRWFGPVTTEDVKALANECGVRLVAGVADLDLAAPFDELGRPLTKEAAAFNRHLAIRLLDLAAELGLEVVRITEPNIGPERQEAAERYMREFGEALASIGEYATNLGIRVAVENYGINLDQMELMLTTADHPNVGTLFDPCNYVRIGEDPLRAALRLRDRIFYCHLKDTRTDESRAADELFPGSRWRPSVALGDGHIDWPPLIAELALSYSGYWAIEYEDKSDVTLGTRRSRAFLLNLYNSAGRSS